MMIGLFLLLLLQAAADTKAMQTADVAFREGSAALAQHNLKGAETAFAKVTQLAPKIAAGHSAYGAVLLAEGSPLPAIHELELARKLDANDPTTLLNLGSAYGTIASGAQSKSPPGSDPSDKAIEAFRSWQAMTGKALPSDAALLVATALSSQGHASAAQQELQSALKIDPENASLLDAAGVLLAQQQNFTEALPFFLKAIQNAPHLPHAYLHLGSTQMALRQADAAIKSLTVGHQLEPDNIDIAYQLALALESAEKPKEAIPYFEEVRAVRSKNPEVLINLALAFGQVGRAKEAVALYKEALPFAPNNATLRQDLGVAYLQQSDLDNAIMAFRQGTVLDPQSAQMVYDLGLALKLKDDLDGATEALKKAQSLDPQLSDAPFTLGVIYMQQGRFDDAATSLRQALALRPGDGDAWAMLGSVYKQNNQPAEAIDALQKAIAVSPGQPGNHINLAAVLAQQGSREQAAAERKIAADLSRNAVNQQRAAFGMDSGNLLRTRGQYAEAAVQYRVAISANPDGAEAHAALADVLMKQGKLAESATEQEKASSLSKQKATQ